MAPSSRLVVLLLVSAVVACVRAHPRFQQEIPNIPTVGGSQWVGVGHYKREGGGQRNPFGLVSCPAKAERLALL